MAPKIKCVNTSSTAYGDLSNNLVEFALANTRLCIGSLQIESVGDFDYQIDRIDDNLLPDMNYPNNYRASRLFWSMKNPREKTVYHLHIKIEQTYHTNTSNHRVVGHPMSPIELHHEQLYERCRKDFEKLQKKIDEHLTNIEEFCQKTMVNKKGLPNATQSRRKNANRREIPFFSLRKSNSLCHSSGYSNHETIDERHTIVRQTTDTQSSIEECLSTT